MSGVNKTGTYFYRKFKNSGAPLFGKADRSYTIDSIRQGTPGPGTYRQHSDFGFYNPADASLTPSTMTRRSPFSKQSTSFSRTMNKTTVINAADLNASFGL